MEKQLSFQLDSRSPGEVKSQRFKQPLSKKKEKLKIPQKKQNSLEKPAWSIESPASELLTDPGDQLRMKFLSLNGKAGQELFSGANPLNTPTGPIQEKDPLFDNLISAKTVAERLGLAPKTIHNWVHLRKIPFVKIGQKVMFRPKSLKAWLNRKEVKSWL